MLSSLLCVAGIAIWGYILVSILKIKDSFGPVLAIAASMVILEIGGAFGVLWQHNGDENLLSKSIDYRVFVCCFVLYACIFRENTFLYGVRLFFSLGHVFQSRIL